ncbi:MAG: glycine cleavage system protein GcvH [bacterium]
MIPEDLKFTDSHEWIRVEGKEVVIGITDYAVEKLGDVVFVELPAVGTDFKKQSSFGVVESVKAVSDLYSPVTGKILSVNEALSGSPDLLNKDPYKEGWMIKVSIADPKELENTLSAKQYKELIEKEG